MLKNDRLLKALRKEPVDCTPVWIMRQAGRYLPEYRAVRAKAKTFMNLCKNPDLACEVTLQPLARFDLDAAILFSDILTIPDAMGLGLEFIEGEGPIFARPITSKADIERLGVPDPEQELRYVIDAVRVIKQSLQQRVPLIGFAGSPWTLATYMVEGSSSKEFRAVKKMAFNEPAALHLLLEKLADAVALYLQAQIAAGVDVVMLFDTWGGILSTHDYHEFSLRYLQRIVDRLKQLAPPGTEPTPIILFTKNGGLWLESIANTGCQGVGIDWTVDIAQARARIGHKVALQGNMDPTLLYASPDRIVREVAYILQAFGQHPGHIFNLGHGITPDVNPEHVAVLVDAVHTMSKR